MRKKKEARESKYSLSSLTEAQRRDKIDTLEDRRDAVILEIEDLLKTAAKAMRRRSLTRRRYKHGKSPNDRRL
jgi:hypothetical protein